jgi:hypothetical protein
MKVHCNVEYGQLCDDEINEIEQRMYPGKYSNDGFLQIGETLREVCENDRLYLKQVNITYKQIADVLTTIVGKYERVKALGREDEYRYKITTDTYMGAQECPFQNKQLDNEYHGYEYGDIDHTITDKITGNSITFNTLLIHMIEAHQFFESQLSQHRLDPIKVIEMFDIRPNIDYQPQYKYYDCWNCLGYANYGKLSKHNINLLTKIALKTYQIADDIIGVLLPYRCNICHDDTFFDLIKQLNPFSWEKYLTKFTHLETNEVDNILQNINSYNQNNKFDDLYLYIINSGVKGDIINITIEGINLKYYSVFLKSEYICSKNRYILLDDEIS